MQAIYGKEAVIHGGSLRDLALDKDPSDIDIAIPYVKGKDFPSPGIVPSGWYPVRTVTKYHRNKGSYKDGVPQVSGNINNYSAPGIEVDVQVIPYSFNRNWFGRHVINNNDFGMNQIGFDGEKLLYNTNFEFDFFSKQFTFRKLGTRYMAENAIKRAEVWKFSGKYDGFKFDCTRAKDFLERTADCPDSRSVG